jgi:hypothetical protein
MKTDARPLTEAVCSVLRSGVLNIGDARYALATIVDMLAVHYQNEFDQAARRGDIGEGYILPAERVLGAARQGVEDALRNWSAEVATAMSYGNPD